MEVFEYYSRVSDDGRLDLPEALKQRIGSSGKLRVMVFLEENESVWERTTTRQFLQGYADEDGIYDEF